MTDPKEIVEGTEEVTPTQLEEITATTEEVATPENSPVEETKAPEETLITDKASEDKFFADLVDSTSKLRDELMQPVEIKNMIGAISVLSKDGVEAHYKVRQSIHLKNLETICIINPMVIKNNQDVVLEVEEALKSAVTSDVANEMKKGLAATLDNIKKYKDEIENMDVKLQQEVEILKQLKAIAESF